MPLYTAHCILWQTSVIVQRINRPQPFSGQRGSAALWALVGVAAFAALAWFCVARHVPLLESQLQSRVVNALPVGSAEAINVSMNGYTAQLTGAVGDPQARNGIIAAVQAVPGVRRVSDELKLVAAPVTANLDDDGQSANVVVLAEEDEAPDATEKVEEVEQAPQESVEEAKPEAEITAAAAPSAPKASENDAAPTPESTDNNQLASTQNDTDSATNNKPAVTLEPPELNVVVDDRSLTVTGRVQEQRSLRPIIETVMTTFDLNYVNNNVETSDTMQPMAWLDGLVASIPAMEAVQAPSIDVFDTQITLSGSVASREQEQAILQSVRDNLSDYTVVDRLRVDPTLDSASESAAPAADNTDATSAEKTDAESDQPDSEQATELEKQKAQQEAEAAEAKAAAAEEAAKQEAAEAKAAAEEAARAAAIEKARAEQIAIQAKEEAKEKALAEAEAARDPVELAAEALNTEFLSLADTRILFFSGNNVLTDESRDRLNDIADLFLNYPNVPIAIKGHTDAQGDESTNLSLSQQRANAVRDFLVARGISVYRLSSFGYGESLPIDTNDTPEGRAANRRIEFSFR